MSLSFVFVSNFLNVHQVPFCEAMVKLLGEGNFTFVATTPFDQERVKSGYEDMNQMPFVVRAYERDADARHAVLDADVVMSIPYAKPDYLRMRMDAGAGLTFAYAERLLKRGLWYRHVPAKRLRVHDAFTRYRYREDFQVLCASAFTSYDLSLFGFPPEHCWKWGYFTRIPEAVPSHASHKDVTTIAWVARLIRLKRPLVPIQLLKALLEDGCNLHLTMIGEGMMRSEIEEYIRNERLTRYVTMTGPLSNVEVHRTLAETDIFLFTSSRFEGWGAVLGEAMSNRCTPIAASRIGSVPFLIQDGWNGLVYKDGNEEHLQSCARRLICNTAERIQMGDNAHKTMMDKWNPEEAARRIIGLSETFIGGSTCSPYTDGPCSPAPVINENWYQGGEIA